MGQQEVVSFLKKHRNKWLTAREISEQMKASFGSVTTSLKKLRESKQIKFNTAVRDSNNSGKRKVFVYKY